MKKIAPILIGLIALVGLIVLIMGALEALSTKSFIGSSAQVTGTVLGKTVRDGVTYPNISYTDLNVQRYTASSIPESRFSPLEANTYVPLFISKVNPRDYRIGTFPYLYLEASIKAGVGFLLLLISGLVFLRLRSKPVFASQPKRPVRKEPAPARKAPSSSATSTRPAPKKPVSPKSKNEDSPEVKAIASDKRPFGPLQPLVDDRTVSDIYVIAHDKVRVVRNGKTSTVNVNLHDAKAYRSLVEKILREADTSFSTAKPIADGVVGSGDNVRIHAINEVLCDKGPYLTIRVSRFSSVSLPDMHRTGLAPKPVLDYLKQIVELGHTILVAGSVGAGKTTLVRALTSEIEQSDSILVIEDTPEVRVEHPNVRYVHTREANISGAGMINMADCIRASLRMAMDRIILGEIRDPEAAEAFIDVCVTGHPGLSTIHSRNSKDALSRLLTLLARNQPGVARSAISDQISAAVQVVVYLKYCDKTDSRRIAEIREIHPNYGTEHPNQLLFDYQVYDSVPGWKKTVPESYFKSDFADHGMPSPLEGLPEFIGL